MLTGPPPKFHGTWDILVLCSHGSDHEKLTRFSIPLIFQAMKPGR